MTGRLVLGRHAHHRVTERGCGADALLIVELLLVYTFAGRIRR